MILFTDDMNTSAVTPTVDDESCEVPNACVTYTFGEVETTTADESATPTISETEIEPYDESTMYTLGTTFTEQILMEQTEETMLKLYDISRDIELDERTQYFAWVVAEILGLWQEIAGDENPTSHQIDFGVGSPVNLLMILSLLPEKYQELIGIDDIHRSPFGNGENMSWLHEQTTDLLVRFSMDPIPAPIRFGQGLASMIRDDVDHGWRVFTGRSWLEDQIHLLSSDELEPDLYHFPPETKKIVFFFNPTEIHWTVVEVYLDDDLWTYTLYNSLFQGERGPTWKACQEQFPLLEQLICRTSGFAEPKARKIVPGTSAQQENSDDCGPIAIYNAIELLEGRRPNSEVDAELLRMIYLDWIFEALEILLEGLELPALRTRMREVCLENSVYIDPDLD